LKPEVREDAAKLSREDFFKKYGYYPNTGYGYSGYGGYPYSGLKLGDDEFFKKYGFYPTYGSLSPSGRVSVSTTSTTTNTNTVQPRPSTTFNTPLTLGYWGEVQGLVQPIRYLLEYTETPYVEKLYGDREEWNKDKPNLGIDFANLPYIIDGGRKVAESLALLNYVPIRAKRNDLLGKTNDDRVATMQFYGVIRDLWQDFGRSFYQQYANEEEFHAKQKANFEKNHQRLTDLEDQIGHQDYLLSYLTWVDFLFFYVIDILSRLDSQTMSNYPGLRDYFLRIANIPQIKKYRESGKIPQHFNGKQAYWRG